MARTAAPTETVTTTSNIPAWAQPYATWLLGQGQDLAKQGYQEYGGPMLAGFNPLQQQAFSDIAAMGVSPQIAQATGLAGLAGLRAQEAGRYTPAAERQFYNAPEMGRVGLDYLRVQAPQATGYQMGPAERARGYEYGPLGVRAPERVGMGPLSMYQMGPAERIGAERFGLGAMQEYMSPYMQGVVEQQKRGAIQDYLRTLPQLGSQAARVGAKGGSREAILESEARRGLAEQLGGIEATGLQQAYQQAASQFGQDRAAQMQAAMANQAAGLTTGQQNLAAALGVQQLGTQTGLQASLANQAAMQRAGEQNLAAEQARQQFMGQQGLQAQLANQQAGLTVGQQNLQAQISQAQFAAQQAMQAGQLNQAAQLQAQAQQLQQQQSLNQAALQNAAQQAQYGLSGAQLAESSRQFGANLGLQGIQQQLAAAGALGGLGQQQYQQGLGISQAQLGAGAQIQALEQQNLANQYQQFLNQQRLPYQQLEFFSGLLRGTPATGQTQNLYQAPGSTLGQVAGLATGLGSLFGGLGGSSASTGGGGLLTSDRRLKSNIVRVGTHPLGVGIYEYDIWGMRQRGVMADEVISVMPEAVAVQNNGYMAVRYDMIGGV